MPPGWPTTLSPARWRSTGRRGRDANSAGARRRGFRAVQACDRGLIPMPARPGSRRGGPTRSLWSAAVGYLAARRNPPGVGVLPIAVEGEHPLDDALDAVTLVRNPAEVAQVL